MKSTIVIYGSSTGTCQAIAEKIASKLGTKAIDVSNATSDDLSAYENLIVGTSTWGAGELQDDWYDKIDLLKDSAGGKTVAVFGCGDSESYGDTFCSAMRALYDAAKAGGASTIGEVSVDGYTFGDSEAVVDGKFIGLPLDDINESDKTEARIDSWTAQLTPAL